mmetsp:Transcript_4583/g.8633  ORF Transcript_4583/g.8633 Transcript_4583/m.8633 type:complete len:222 (-) Transcript_4583:96-761(-)
MPRLRPEGRRAGFLVSWRRRITSRSQLGLGWCFSYTKSNNGGGGGMVGMVSSGGNVAGCAFMNLWSFRMNSRLTSQRRTMRESSRRTLPDDRNPALTCLSGLIVKSYFSPSRNRSNGLKKASFILPFLGGLSMNCLPMARASISVGLRRPLPSSALDAFALPMLSSGTMQEMSNAASHAVHPMPPLYSAEKWSHSNLSVKPGQPTTLPKLQGKMYFSKSCE